MLRFRKQNSLKIPILEHYTLLHCDKNVMRLLNASFQKTEQSKNTNSRTLHIITTLYGSLAQNIASYDI